MSTKTAPARSSQEWACEPVLPGGIVVGIDGSAVSLAALETAGLLASRWKCAVHVVSALPPFSSYKLKATFDESRSEVEDLRLQLRDGILRDLVASVDESGRWTRQVVIGRPAQWLADTAERRGARLLVVGRSQHGPADRILGGETTLQTMRLASVPVLAVSSPLADVDSAVAACDFSPASTRAAQAAIDLMGAKGALYLVYVEPPLEVVPPGYTGEPAGGGSGELSAAFRRVTASLRIPPGIVVETVVLNGNPVSSILEFTASVGADLIAAGAQSLSGLERLLLGSVSTGLVRNATTPVVVAHSSVPQQYRD